MIIRNAQLFDLKRCEELSDDPEILWVNGKYYDEDFLNHYLQDDGHFLIIEVNGRIIGYLLGEKIKAKGAIVWAFILDENHRGKGYGSKLYEHFEKNVKNAGGEWIYLIARANNEKLRDFYIKRGFIEGTKNIEYTKESL